MPWWGILICCIVHLVGWGVFIKPMTVLDEKYHCSSWLAAWYIVSGWLPGVWQLFILYFVIQGLLRPITWRFAKRA